MDYLPLQVCGALWCGWVVYWAASAHFTLKIKKNETIARLQHTIPTTIGVLTIFFPRQFPIFDWGQLYTNAAIAWLGVPITIAGHAFSVWARIHIGKYWSGTVALKHDHKIVDTGPYALVRHPIYTGLLASAFGSAMAAGTKEAFFGFAVMILGYIVKWKREEKLLLQEFGAAYADYMKRTKTIIPYLY